MVLVTGGTSGIGLAIAQGFRKAGATVIFASLLTSLASALQELEVSDITNHDYTNFHLFSLLTIN